MASLNAVFHSVAHRGASFYFPEESKPAYILAAEHGVNFIECDIVSTKDGILILRHSPNLSESTNVDSFYEFEHLRKHEVLYNDDDGDVSSGIFSWDLTYEEIKKIKCTHEKKYPKRDQHLNGVYNILTLDEFLEMSISEFKGFRPGLYIEIKYPTMHKSKGLDITDKLLKTLDKFGLNKKCNSIFIQSFEPSNLEYIRKKSELNLVQLLTRDSKNSFVYAVEDEKKRMVYKPCDLEYISKFASVVSPFKEDLISPISEVTNKYITGKSSFITIAHELGLIVVPYTFRPESVMKQFKDIFEEYDHFIRTLKSDGVFTDDSKSIIEYLSNKQEHQIT
ncbi:glycerophosphodiester phosphodiesterase [Cryptosporidium felis]|nr:glycerophosphodiester phosphodiesterase [Cryptosporidium felis]